MTVPEMFGWFVLVVLVLLIGRLTKITHGWKVIACMLVLASAVSCGYQLGYDNAARTARQTANSLETERCRIDYGDELEAHFAAVDACVKEISRVQGDVADMQLPAWFFFAYAAGAVLGIFYLAVSIETFLRERSESALVVTPKGDQQQAKARPRQRRKQKTGGPE